MGCVAGRVDSSLQLLCLQGLQNSVWGQDWAGKPCPLHILLRGTDSSMFTIVEDRAEVLSIPRRCHRPIFRFLSVIVAAQVLSLTLTNAQLLSLFRLNMRASVLSLMILKMIRFSAGYDRCQLLVVVVLLSSVHPIARLARSLLVSTDTATGASWSEV